MNNFPAFVLLVMLMASSPAIGQPPEKVAPSIFRGLEDSIWYLGSPGGMLFHTAFHQGVTTRYLLLKAADHSEVLANYLELTPTQLETIRQLQPATSQAGDAVDKNSQPDEQSVDPKYFAFLDARQLGMLDALALRLDGYPAITRESLAERLELSDKTRREVMAAIRDIREEIYFPWFRWKYAAKLPDDIDMRETEFSGRLSTYANLKIILVLTDDERLRLAESVAEKWPPPEVIESLEKLMPYPDGVQALRRLADTASKAVTK